MYCWGCRFRQLKNRMCSGDGDDGEDEMADHRVRLQLRGADEAQRCVDEEDGATSTNKSTTSTRDSSNQVATTAKGTGNTVSTIATNLAQAQQPNNFSHCRLW